jgi:hypothetical protein
MQIGGGVGNMTFITPRRPRIEIAPSNDSIGANGLLKERIKEAFGKLGTEREKRFGKSAYGVMYAKFKSDFKIPDDLPWTIIWDWPASRSAEIIEYLSDKFTNTIAGKVENAAKKPGYLHNHGHLFAREKELLGHLGMKPSSPEIKEEMRRLFGTDSHKNLDLRQHANWVSYIERRVDQMYEAKD